MATEILDRLLKGEKVCLGVRKYCMVDGKLNKVVEARRWTDEWFMPTEMDLSEFIKLANRE